jgi:hypothetical protein
MAEVAEVVVGFGAIAGGGTVVAVRVVLAVELASAGTAADPVETAGATPGPRSTGREAAVRTSRATPAASAVHELRSVGRATPGMCARAHPNRKTTHRSRRQDDASPA